MSLRISNPAMMATTTPIRRKSFTTNARSRSASRSRTGEGSPLARGAPGRTGAPARPDLRAAVAVVTGRSCAAGRALGATEVRRWRVDRRCLFGMRGQGYGNGYCFWRMPLDTSALSFGVVALFVAVIGLAGWISLLQRSEARLRHRLRRILDEGGTTGLDEVLGDQTKRIEALGKGVESLDALQRELQVAARLALQRVGVVRFNPFQDSGGDQSFAIALLDRDGTGIIVSSLHGRTETRIFAKQIDNGRSTHTLSDEEQQAIRAALQ